MNSRKKTISNLFKVALGNASTIVSGIFVGFLIPKILSIPDYGMYKTFTLYTSYVGFFTLGIIDGIVLKYGDKEYREIEKEKFRCIFDWYVLIQLLFSTILCVLGFVVFEKDARFIVVSLAVNVILLNMVEYFQQISQITQRFKEFSTVKILRSVFNSLSVLVLYIAFAKGNIIIYKNYIVLVTVNNAFLAFWYIKTYIDIVVGKRNQFLNTKGELCGLIQEGFPLFVANLCSSLILSIDKQFVNILFPTEEYAIYSFAYNMLSLVTLATSAFATVLYPILKRTSTEKLKEKYNLLISLLLIIIYAALLSYFPLCYIVNGFLPKYAASLAIFRIIFPGLAISSCVTIVMHNYYKTLGNNLLFLKKSLLILALTCVTNALAYILFGTTKAISWASILTMAIWYLLVENDLVKKYQIDRWNNIFFALISMMAFYIFSAVQNSLLGMAGYAVFLFFAVIIMKKDILKQILR